jgi:hypothetical protein
MNKYYIDYPRNFANEYAIYSVGTAEEQAAINHMIDRSATVSPERDIHRISRRDAYALTASNRAAYRNGSATYNNPAGATSICSFSDVYGM